jgi:hypothetical protein
MVIIWYIHEDNTNTVHCQWHVRLNVIELNKWVYSVRMSTRIIGTSNIHTVRLLWIVQHRMSETRIRDNNIPYNDHGLFLSPQRTINILPNNKWHQNHRSIQGRRQVIVLSLEAREGAV